MDTLYWAAVGLAVLGAVAWLVWHEWRLAGEARTEREQQADQDRAWLARRGWRLEGNALFRVTHEDDEGWWSGDVAAVLVRPTLANAVAAAKRLEGK